METKFKRIFNPFQYIAGYQSLYWGIAGIAVATVLSMFSRLHYNGLMHFGPGVNNAWWCFTMEHLAVWLVPALLFYLGALFFSKSHIRPVDVLGTVALAQSPFILMNLFFFIPSVQNTILTPEVYNPEWLSRPDVMQGFFWIFVSMLFFIWVLVLMFNALKVTCNLKGSRLVTLYIVAIVVGDILCRIIISSLS